MVFFGDLAPTLDALAADAMLLDAAFQRDEARSLHANAGLFMMRVSAATEGLFATVESILRAAAVPVRADVHLGSSTRVEVTSA